MNTNSKLRVALFFGGVSSEHDVSCVSASAWLVAQGPSESPRPLARPALRARAPLSLRDISPRSGESPFDKGAFLSPLRGFGGTPEFTNGAEGAGVKNEK